jgi:uncharacterized protein with PQ loop repeat
MLPAKIRIGLCLLYHSPISCKEGLLRNGILLLIFPITLYRLSNIPVCHGMQLRMCSMLIVLALIIMLA